MPVKGISQAKASYKTLVRRVAESKNPKVMQEVLVIGATNASLLTPVDTSFLINSQFKRIINRGSRLIGQVGYGAGYALYVHDPKNHQNFQKASAEKEFLTKGFERDGLKQIRRTIINGLKL